MTTVNISSSNFSYICEEATIYPPIVYHYKYLRVNIVENQTPEAEERNAKKLRNFINENF